MVTVVSLHERCRESGFLTLSGTNCSVGVMVRASTAYPDRKLYRFLTTRCVRTIVDGGGSAMAFVSGTTPPPPVVVL